jgi:hypothetical protein
MTCDEVLLELDGHARGELPAARAARVREHLAGCAGCREEAAFAARLAGALAETRPAAPAVDPDALTARVLETSRAGRVARRARPRAAPASGLAPAFALAASVALVVGLGAWAGLRERGPAPAQDVAARDRAPEVEPGPSVTPGTGAERVEPRVDEPPPALVEPSGPPPPSPTTPLPEQPAAVVDVPTPEASDAPDAPDALDVTETRVPRGATPRGLAGVVLAARGRAEASSDGGRTWSDVAAGAALAPGARVRVGRGGGLLAALAEATDEPEVGGARVALSADAEVSFAEAGAVRLEAGACFAQLDRRVAIVAGGTRVDAGAADVEVRLARTGRVAVCVSQGVATLSNGVTLRAGQQVEVDPRGRVGRPRRGPERAPAWSAEASAPRRVLLHEALDDWARTGARRVGRARGDGTVEGEAPAAGASARQVSFGKSEAEGGLVHVTADARLRLRYRVARTTALRVQVMDHTLNDNVHVVTRAPRAGVWTVLDVRLDRLADNAKRGRRVSSGDLIGYVTLEAEADAEGPVTLEVDEVTIFTE